MERCVCSSPITCNQCYSCWTCCGCDNKSCECGQMADCDECKACNACCRCTETVCNCGADITCFVCGTCSECCICVASAVTRRNPWTGLTISEIFKRIDVISELVRIRNYQIPVAAKVRIAEELVKLGMELADEANNA